MRTLPSCGEQGLLSRCSAQTFHCGGFCFCRAQALGHWGLSSGGAQALEQRQLWCVGLRLRSVTDLPRSGVKPMSPALAGGFWATREVLLFLLFCNLYFPFWSWTVEIKLLVMIVWYVSMLLENLTPLGLASDFVSAPSWASWVLVACKTAMVFRSQHCQFFFESLGAQVVSEMSGSPCRDSCTVWAPATTTPSDFSVTSESCCQPEGEGPFFGSQKHS